MSQSLSIRSLSPAGESKFRRLSITHAAMMAGDAAMVVALADSKFLSISPEEGREQVLLFLVVSFAPFLLIAPLIGPFLDRVAGGRRAVIQFVACARVVLSVLMAFLVDELVLFPLVFVALVLQKTYLISKSAIVPSVVRTENELVEANSKLGMIAGFIGFVAVVPAALLQLVIGSTGTLIYGAIVFGYCLFASTYLEADVVAREQPDEDEIVELSSPSVMGAAIVMMLLRAVGRIHAVPHGVLVARPVRRHRQVRARGCRPPAIATVIGNASASRIRRFLKRGADAPRSAGDGGRGRVGGRADRRDSRRWSASRSSPTSRRRSAGSASRRCSNATRPTPTGAGRSPCSKPGSNCRWAAAGLIPWSSTMSGPTGALVIGLTCAAGVAFTRLRPRRAPVRHAAQHCTCAR